MQQFMGGQLSVSDLQRMGQQRTGTREGATSFMVKRGAIGQQMMAKGGMGGIAQAMSGIMERSGYGDASESIQNMFIQKMTGLSSSESELMRRMMDDLPRIRDEEMRQVEGALNDSMRRLELRRNRSWQAVKDSFSHVMKKHARPFQEFGEAMATNISEATDEMVNSILGIPTASPTMAAGEKTRRLLTGAAGGAAGVDLGFESRGLSLGTPALERMRRTGFITSGSMEGTRGQMVSSLLGSEGVTVGGLQRPGAAVAEGMVGLGIRRGRSVTASAVDVKEAVRRARIRVSSPMEAAKGVISRSDASAADVERAKNALHKTLFSTGDAAARLRDAKARSDDRGEGHYADAVLSEMKRVDPEGYEALSRAGGDRVGMLDLMAGFQSELGFDNNRSVDFQKMSAQVGSIRDMDSVALSDFRDRQVSSLMESFGRADASKAAARGALIGSMVMPGLGVLVGGAIGSALALGGEGLNEADMRELSTVGWSKDFAKFLETGDVSEGNMFIQASKKPGLANRLWEMASSMSPEQRRSHAEAVRNMARVGDAQLDTETVEKRKTIAGKELDRISKVSSDAIGASAMARYRGQLEKMKRSGRADQAQMLELGRSLAGDREAIQAMRGAGAVGGQIAAIAELESMQAGQGLTEKQLGQQMRRVSGAVGYDVLGTLRGHEPFRKRLEGFLEDKEISSSELAAIKKMGQQAITRLGPEAGRGRAETNQALEARYKEMNTRFVFVATDAIARLQGRETEEYTKLAEIAGNMGENNKVERQ
jgi:hypothetical protein